MRSFAGLFLVFLAAAGFGSAQAAPGFLDRTFGDGFGYVRFADATSAATDTGSAIAVQADGKILVGGASGIEPGVVVLRYNLNGTLDDSFGTHGAFRWKRDNERSGAQKIIPLADGRIFVFGFAASAEWLWMARLNADGTLDGTFGAGGVAIVRSEGYVADGRRALVDDRGGIVVIWESRNPLDNRIRISRFLAPTGAADPGYAFGAGEVVLSGADFGAQTNLPFGAVFDPQGRLMVFASAWNATYNTTLIWRFDRSGFTDTFFGDKGMLALRQPNYAFYGRKWTVVADRGQGYLLVEWTPNGVRLQRFDLAGHVVTSYGAGGTTEFVFNGGAMEPGNAVVRPDGSVIVTGTKQRAGIHEVFVLGVTVSGALDTRLGTDIAQRTYRGTDFGTAPGMTGADLALAGSDIVIGGTAATTSAGDDITVLKLLANGAPNPAFAATGRATWNGGGFAPEEVEAIWPGANATLLALTRTGGAGGAGGAGAAAMWRRFTANGQPDGAYGTGGRRAIAGDWSGDNVRVFTQSDGRIVLARQRSGTAFTNVTTVARFLADGAVDSSFGSNGTLSIVDDAHDSPVKPGVAQLPSGKLLIATYGDNGLRLRRTSIDGASDLTFGNGTGVVYPPLPGRPQIGYTIAIQADGRILIGASTIVVSQLPLPQLTLSSDVVVRLLPDGSLDPSFGLRGGVVPLQIENARDPQIVRIIPLAGGKLLVAGNITRLGAMQFFFVRLNGDGSVDSTYGDHTDGADGPGPFVFSSVLPTELSDAALDAQGRLVISGTYATDRDRATAFVIRFLADGTIDPTFGGSNRHIFLFERPEATSGANALALLGNSIIAGGFNGEYGLLVKLDADGSAFAPSQSVLEFVNTPLKHYFVTADLAEAAAIEAGSAGAGWQRTGSGFRAWTSKAGIPPEAVPVCRFYGTAGLGPNSHFYTADVRECEAVRADPGWRYEGIAFYSIVPGTTGCPTGMMPVRRLYNNRFAQNDSNHRYTTNPDVVAAMQAQGWTDEGVVLCSPTN